MFTDVTEGLYDTAIRNEVHKYLEKYSHQWDELAKECAVEMLEEIKQLLDDPIPLEEMRMKIMRIVLFMDTPPYPKRKKRGRL